MSHPLVVVIDPAWSFGDALPGGSRGAAKQYACMGVAEHADYVRPYVDGPNVALFCWRVASMQDEALELVRVLGFKVKAELEWRKTTKTGKPWFGMGRYFRNSHETCLLAVRGRAFPEVRDQRSFFYAPVREHSRKPNEFYAIVERMYPSSRKVELFSRQHRHGWTCHGHEVDKFAEAVERGLVPLEAV